MCSVPVVSLSVNTVISHFIKNCKLKPLSPVTFGPNVVKGGLCSPGSDENADVSFAEHVLEAAPVDNYVPGKAFSLQHKV